MLDMNPKHKLIANLFQLACIPGCTGTAGTARLVLGPSSIATWRVLQT